MKIYVPKQTSEITVRGSINHCLGKRKKRWYTIPIKVLHFSSFEKQKESLLTCQKSTEQKVDEYKETHNIYK